MFARSRVQARRLVLVASLFVLSAAGQAVAQAGFDPDVVPFSDKFPVEIAVPEHASVYELARLGIDIDAVGDGWVRAYLSPSEVQLVELLGYVVRRIPNQALRMARALDAKGDRDEYHNYAQLTTYLQGIAADHPSITRLVSIGQTVQGRELWFMKITDNPDTEENEPEFKYISTMHGDEPVGTENCLKFIDLLTDNYELASPDRDLERLVDEVEIWILPMMNPDGNNAGSRYNAHGVDLNRDFPDWITDPHNTPDGREPETQAVMIFSDSMAFDLSANFHTGALVVNYPWDRWATLSPDDALFINMSEAYSIHITPMWNSPVFYHGITNGWQWYEIHGGMQDWNYDWMYNKEVTIELCNTKWPSASQLPGLWDDNRESMLAYLEYCLHGVRGVVTDASTGLPLAATVSVTEVGWDDRTDPEVGDYHRILDPGTYTLVFSCPGYQSQQFSSVGVVADSATVLDVQLISLEQVTVSGTVTSASRGPLLAKVEAFYHSSGLLADSTTTDPSDGSYSLNVPRMEYDFKASATGYAPEYQLVDVQGDTTLHFVLSPVSGQVLVVDDDSGKRLLEKDGLREVEVIVREEKNAASDIADDLTLLGYETTLETATSTDPGTWSGYDMVVWSAGSNSAPVGAETERRNLLDYVAAGGKLLIEGGEVAYDAVSYPGYPNFADSVLHSDDWDGDEVGDLPIVAEQSSHPIATDPNPLPATLSISYSGWYAEDAAHPASDAYIVYGTASYPDDGGVLVYDAGGVKGDGQIVFFAFSYSVLSDRGAARSLLQNVVTYLASSHSDVAEEPVRVVGRGIEQIVPNPFNPATSISFSVPVRQTVELAVFDVRGRRVITLVDGEVDAGPHRVEWDARDEGGREIASGVYFCRLKTEAAASTRKMVKLN